MPPTVVETHLLNFDIDRYLNPWIPHNRLYVLPSFVSRWLGYRTESPKEPYVVLQWPITIIATIAGLCLVGGIGNHAHGITSLHPPVIVASLGASAILDYNTIKSPLAQPRNAVIGNTLAAICGVAMSKLFQLNSNFNNIEWVSGAVGCALASWVMGVTNTIHPPGGATAVLASTEASVIAMGWWFVPVVLLDSVLLVIVALIFNNIMRQYPTFWWTPLTVGKKLRDEKKAEEQASGDEQNEKNAEEGGAGGKHPPSDTSSDRTLHRETSNGIEHVDGLLDIQIRPYKIRLPTHVELFDEEVMMLAKIQERLLYADVTVA